MKQEEYDAYVRRLQIMTPHQLRVERNNSLDRMARLKQDYSSTCMCDECRLMRVIDKEIRTRKQSV